MRAVMIVILTIAAVLCAGGLTAAVLGGDDEAMAVDSIRADIGTGDYVEYRERISADLERVYTDSPDDVFLDRLYGPSSESAAKIGSDTLQYRGRDVSCDICCRMTESGLTVWYVGAGTGIVYSEQNYGDSPYRMTLSDTNFDLGKTRTEQTVSAGCYAEYSITRMYGAFELSGVASFRYTDHDPLLREGTVSVREHLSTDITVRAEVSSVSGDSGLVLTDGTAMTEDEFLGLARYDASADGGASTTGRTNTPFGSRGTESRRVDVMQEGDYIEVVYGESGALYSKYVRATLEDGTVLERMTALTDTSLFYCPETGVSLMGMTITHPSFLPSF